MVSAGGGQAAGSALPRPTLSLPPSGAEALVRLRAHWRMPAVAALVAAAVTVALWFASADQYKASATLVLARPDARIALDERFSAAPADPAFPYRVGSVRTYPELARDRSVARDVLASIEADPAPPPAAAFWRGRDVDSLRGAVRARAAADGTLLVVEASSRSPEAATWLANEWAAVFSRRMDTLLGSSARAGADAERAALASAEATLEALDVEARSVLVDLEPAVRDAEADALGQRYRQVLERVDRLRDLEAAADRLAGQLNGFDPDGDGGQASAGGALMGLEALRLAHESARVHGGARVVPGSAPPAVDGDLEVALGADTLFAVDAADLVALRDRSAAARAAAEAELDQLGGELTRAQVAASEARHRVEAVERARRAASDRVDALARRAGEVEASAATAGPELRLAAEAVPPARRDVGGLARRTAAAMVLGAMAGALLALLWRPPAEDGRGDRR